MFLDTFISEENDSVLYFFKKKLEKIFYFAIQNKNSIFIKVQFTKSEKTSLATHLATFPSSFSVMWFWGIT